jgi:hypothetical protein
MLYARDSTDIFSTAAMNYECLLPVVLSNIEITLVHFDRHFQTTLGLSSNCSHFTLKFSRYPPPPTPPPPLWLKGLTLAL